MDDAACDGPERRLARIACDLDVAEAVEREARLVDLLPIASQHVAIRGPGGPEVRGIDSAVGVQGLGVAQGHFRSGLALNPETHPPDHVPAHVEDVDSA